MRREDSWTGLGPIKGAGSTAGRLLEWTLRGTSVHAVLIAAVILTSCGSDPKKQTPAEWVKENTLIISQLASYRREEQQEGINRFLALGKEQGSAVVAYFLDDPAVSQDQRVVVILARILSMWKDARGVPYLLDALGTSQDDGVLRIAAEGLMAYGAMRQIVLRLEETAGDAREVVRVSSITVLSNMRTPEALEILGKRLKSEPSVDVRGVCLLGVTEAPPSGQRTGFLIDALTDPDEGIREHAWGVLRTEKGVPQDFDPHADLAARAQSISDLRRWASSSRR